MTTNHPVHIAIAFDQNYLKQFYALLVSLFENNPGTNFQLHVIATGVPSRDWDRIKAFVATHASTLQAYTIDERMVNEFVLLNKWTVAVYYRLLFPLLIDPKIDRLLYIDTDTLVVGDIKVLYDSDLLGHPVGAVYDSYVKTQPLIGIEEEGQYFNSGVLLIDVPRWRELRITQKASDYLRQYPERILFVDQCALNAVLTGNWTRLDYRFNVIYSYIPQELAKKERHEFIQGKVILHFTLQRPWNFLCQNRYRYLYFYYLRRSPMGPFVLPYGDFSIGKLMPWLLLRLKEFYRDYPLLQRAWRRLKMTRS